MQGVHQDFANWKVKSPATPRPHRGRGFKWLVHYRSWTGPVLFTHWLLAITYTYTYDQDIRIPNSIHEVAGLNSGGGGLLVQQFTSRVKITLLLLNTTCLVLANIVDPDQLASSSEANWSGSALFVIKYMNFYKKKPGSSNLIGWEL